MRRLLLLSSLISLYSHVTAQAPFVEYAMINSCGTEGSNEFIVLNTGPTSIDVQRIRFEYSQVSLGTPDPVIDGRIPGIWVPSPSGGGILNSNCTLMPITSGIVPANSKILIIPSLFETSYNVSNFCTGGNLYVLYFNVTLATSWTTTISGNFANTASDPLNLDRYMRITYYDPGNIPVSVQERIYFPNSLTNYMGSGNGAGVRWPDAATTQYLNTGCTQAVLPLQVLSFSGQLVNGYASFEATLAQNETSYHCVLERSNNGRDFSPAELIEVQPSQGVTHLQFTDPAVVVDRSLYRLKLQDYNNKIVYSATLIIRQEKQKNELSLLNSISGNVVANLYTDQRQMVTLRAINTNGQVLWSRQQQVDKGWNSFSLDRPGTAAQVVIIQVSGKNFLLSRKLLVR